MLLGKGLFFLSFISYHEVKPSKRFPLINICACICGTANMGKNLAIGDIIVGKIKNLNRSGCVVLVVGVGHKCRIRV